MELAEFEMDRVKFDELCLKIMREKRPAYTNRDGNVLANFDSIARRTGLEPAMVAYVLMLKHVDAIGAYLGGNETDPEPIELRLVDNRNYTDLLHAIFTRAEAKYIVDAQPAGFEFKPGACNIIPMSETVTVGPPPNTWIDAEVVETMPTSEDHEKPLEVIETTSANTRVIEPVEIATEEQLQEVGIEAENTEGSMPQLVTISEDLQAWIDNKEYLEGDEESKPSLEELFNE